MLVNSNGEIKVVNLVGCELLWLVFFGFDEIFGFLGLVEESYVIGMVILCCVIFFILGYDSDVDDF